MLIKKYIETLDCNSWFLKIKPIKLMMKFEFPCDNFHREKNWKNRNKEHWFHR